MDLVLDIAAGILLATAFLRAVSESFEMVQELERAGQSGTFASIMGWAIVLAGVVFVAWRLFRATL